MSDTERIEFGDGNWWEVRTVVTRGMRKAFNRAQTLGVLGNIKLNGDSDIDLTDASARRALLLAHLSELDLDALDDAYLLQGTVATSLVSTITPAMLDTIPDQYTNAVLERLRVLYAPLSEEALKK